MHYEKTILALFLAVTCAFGAYAPLASAAS